MSEQCPSEHYQYPSEPVRADELTSADVIESHDGDFHDVEAVSQDGDTVTVNVHKRHSGESYSVEFPADHTVRVLS